jgi:hypothetical protein
MRLLAAKRFKQGDRSRGFLAMRLFDHGICGAAGILALLFVLPAGAQENLDRGKTAAQMFASDCALCHKTPQGLAKNAGLFGLDSFLRQHYTASRESAAALSKYLEAQGDAPPPAAKRTQRSTKSSAKKPAEAKSGDVKSNDTKADAKAKDAKPAEAKAKPKPEPTAEPKPKAESKVESKPEPKAEPKPEAKSEPKADPKSEAKSEAKPAAADKPAKSD